MRLERSEHAPIESQAGGTTPLSHSVSGRNGISAAASRSEANGDRSTSMDDAKEITAAIPSHGFKMKIKGIFPQRKRKRGAVGTPNMSLSGSSSSSSDEDEHATKESTAKNAKTGQLASQLMLKEESEKANGEGEESDSAARERKNLPEKEDEKKKETSPAHNEGWRVKLYRLNADGSWDDCGTGSILCLYKKTGRASTTTATTRSTTSGDAWVYQELGEPTLCMHSEVKNHSAAASRATPKILLRTRILLRDAYQRQGDNIITWCEPYLEEGNSAQGVDLALSFQDIAGCLDIWRQITQVQSNAAELFRNNGDKESVADNEHKDSSPEGHDSESEDSSESTKSGAAQDLDHGSSAAQNGKLPRQQQQEVWVGIASEAAQHHLDHQNNIADRSRDRNFEETPMANSYPESNMGHHSMPSVTPQSPQLPNPPRLAKLEEIADTIAAVQHIQQREALALYISQNECSYLKSLLSLFPSAESRGDYGSLATLAACVKTILLLNDPSIIELIISDELIFEEVCSTLEYDPDLRDKANHRWFLRERAKFRTVTLMEDEELIASIHRSFRVTYLRDTLLRPTMDESSLSTLSSLQTFTHGDVVKGVTMTPAGSGGTGDPLRDSYLAKIIRMLGRELEAICDLEWKELLELPEGGDIKTLLLEHHKEPETDPSTVVVTGKYPQSQKLSRVWKQYLAPQDGSLVSRRMRMHGCVTFLRELFNMVRISLQQSDKDDFYAVLVQMEVDLDYETEKSRMTSNYSNQQSTSNDAAPRTEQKQYGITEKESTRRTASFLGLLGTSLADPNTDVTEKNSVLEVVSGIIMHDPGLVRRRCLELFVAWKRERRIIDKYFNPIGPIRPHPNEKRQVLFHCPPNDLLGSLTFLLATETDAGILLQVTEIMRTLLETDIMTDHGPMGGGFTGESEGGHQAGHNTPHDQHKTQSDSSTTSSDQNQFLSMFYDHYVPWLAAPFQYKILHPIRRVPKSVLEAQGDSAILKKIIERFEHGHVKEEPFLVLVPKNAIRSSFAVELLSFCARAHLYRMKCYLLRSRILGNILKVLGKPESLLHSSSERCLILAALRFLRSILSVKDEFYHRHIIQHNLFAPVFEAFRSNPVGDNLVSSAIVEMCDFIHSENIKSLVEHIVTKHLSSVPDRPAPSLEDVSSPYVTTLTTLRRAYEKNLKMSTRQVTGTSNNVDTPTPADEAQSEYFPSNAGARNTAIVLNEKAREDQRKFREIDQEESYFDTDDDDTPTANTLVPPGVDEVAIQEAENNLHRAPRMFSLAHAPLLNGGQLRLEEQKPSDIHRDNVMSTGETATTSATAN